MRGRYRALSSGLSVLAQLASDLDDAKRSLGLLAKLVPRRQRLHAAQEWIVVGDGGRG